MKKGSEASSVEPVDWRTEKPLTNGSETSSVELVLHVQRVPAQSISESHRVSHLKVIFASLNERKDQGQRHVCADNVVEIVRLKVSLPQCFQMI